MDLASQYSSSANLAARIALHQRFSTNPYPFQRWVFDRLDLRGRVLEIACGTGSLWRENRDRIPPHADLVLTDISLGMIHTTAGVLRAKFAACAMPHLPFAHESFDLVIANHMLYHVDDRPRGLAEIHRVLRPGGTLFATTNGVDHLREIKDLMRDFSIDGWDVSSSFTLENGEEQIRGAFGNVRREDHQDSLEVTDPEILLGYIASFSEQAAETVRARHEEMRAAIGGGTFRIRKSTGAFVAIRD